MQSLLLNLFNSNTAWDKHITSTLHDKPKLSFHKQCKCFTWFVLVWYFGSLYWSIYLVYSKIFVCEITSILFVSQTVTKCCSVVNRLAQVSSTCDPNYKHNGDLIPVDVLRPEAKDQTCNQPHDLMATTTHKQINNFWCADHNIW